MPELSVPPLFSLTHHDTSTTTHRPIILPANLSFTPRCRKKQKGAQKVLQEYASVIAVAVLFVAVCAMVALRGNTIYWKNEAAAAQKSLNAAHVKHVQSQVCCCDHRDS